MVPYVVDKLYIKGVEIWIIEIDNIKGLCAFFYDTKTKFFQKCNDVLMDGTFSSCPSLFNNYLRLMA